jgi:dTDP-4-amino-4,6-dideoxygalactose transaminase
MFLFVFNKRKFPPKAGNSYNLKPEISDQYSIGYVNTLNQNMFEMSTELYYKNLQGVGDVILPPQKSTEQDWTHVYHQFVIRTKHRDSLKKFLNDKGIETAIHYPTPIHLQQAYQFLNLKKESLPEAERLSETVLSLPIWPGLLPEEAEFISQKVTDFFHHL